MLLMIIVFQFNKDFLFKQNETNLLNKIESFRTSLNVRKYSSMTLFFLRLSKSWASLCMLADFFSPIEDCQAFCKYIPLLILLGKYTDENAEFRKAMNILFMLHPQRQAVSCCFYLDSKTSLAINSYKTLVHCNRHNLSRFSYVMKMFEHSF